MLTIGGVDSAGKEALALSTQVQNGSKLVGFGGLPDGQVDEVLSIQGHSESELVASVQFIGTQDGFLASHPTYASAVVKLLGHQSPPVIVAAAEALGNMGAAGARHASEVAAVLPNESVEVKVAAAFALGQFGRPAQAHAGRLAGVVAAASGNDEGAIRTKVVALQALGQVGAASEADLAAGFLGDKSQEVQAAACLALAGMGVTQRASDIARKLQQDGTRLAAVAALGALGDEAVLAHAATIVSQALCAEDMICRSEALAVLGKCGERADGLAAQLAPLLSSSAPAQRAAGALALGSLGSKGAAQSAVQQVAALLLDTSEDLTWVPQQVGGSVSREPMAMRKPRCAALLALGSMGAGEQAKDIAGLLEDSDWEVRFCALEALACLGRDAKAFSGSIVACLEDSTYPVRAKACFALGALGLEDEAERLVDLLRDKAQAVRIEAVAALAALPRAARELTSQMARLLSDASNNVRAAAIKALASLDEMARPYAGVLARSLADPAPDVRAASCSALAGMGDHGAAFAEEVAGLLEDAVLAVRVAAARAMGEFGVEALPFVQALRRVAEESAGSEDQAAVQAALQRIEELSSLALEDAGAKATSAGRPPAGVLLAEEVELQE